METAEDRAIEVAEDVAPRRRRLASPKPLGRILPRLRPYRGRLAVAAVCLVIAAGVGLAFPAVVRGMLDSAFQRHDATLLEHIALALLALFALQGVMNFVQVYLLTSTTERVIAELREDVFGHLVRLSPGFFTERRTGELTSRISADLTLLQSLLSTWVSEMSRQSLLLVGGIVMLTVTHWRLTATTLAVVPIVVGAAFIFGRRLRRASSGVQDRVAEAMAQADEAFAQIRTVQSFTREEYETRTYRELLSDVVTAAIARAWIRALFFGVVGFIAFGGVVAVLYEGGILVLQGQLTAGALVSFLLYAITVAAAVGSLASLFGSYQEAVGAATRVFELLETQPTVREPADPVPLAKPVRGAVRFEHVGFRYAEHLPEVLHDVTLDIAPGEVVALVGPSGAGKTTIASLLLRFWDVTRGAVLLDGADVRDLSFADLRGSIGLVPQEPALFSGSIRENIEYAGDDGHAGDEGRGTRGGATALNGNPRHEGDRDLDRSDSSLVPRPSSLDRVLAAARAAHAHEFIERLPQGYDTKVGERGVKLSGGQRQRLAIARVFLRNPAVVVLDEATSSLDNESERLVERAMEDLLRGRSTLIIAHRLSTVRRADRVVVLEHGRIVEQGPHEELLARDGLYARLYRGQFRGAETGAGVV